MSKITIHHDDIEISIVAGSEQIGARDLYTKAVVALIEGADPHGWEKQELEHGGGADALSEFCAAVLTAVTRLYVSEAGLPEDEQIELPPLGVVDVPRREPAHLVLARMIEHLREADYLNDEVGGYGAEDPEDLN